MHEIFVSSVFIPNLQEVFPFALKGFLHRIVSNSWIGHMWIKSSSNFQFRITNGPPYRLIILTFSILKKLLQWRTEGGGSRARALGAIRRRTRNSQSALYNKKNVRIRYHFYFFGTADHVLGFFLFINKCPLSQKYFCTNNSSTNFI